MTKEVSYDSYPIALYPLPSWRVPWSPAVPMSLFPADNDRRLAMTTSIWDRLSRANSIVTMNLRRLHNVILIAGASLDTISRTRCP